MPEVRRKTHKEIEEKVNDLLSDFGLGNDFPVNIEEIVEIHLGLKIIPQRDMASTGVGEAFITLGSKEIIVDYDLYMNEARKSRLAFSLAHEIAHYILHKEIFDSISSFSEYDKQILNMPSEKLEILEKEADKFAGYLLLPRNLLEKELKDCISIWHKWDLRDTASIVRDLSLKANCHQTTVCIQLQTIYREKLPSNVSAHLTAIINSGRVR